jgi:hypothetical protein
MILGTVQECPTLGEEKRMAGATEAPVQVVRTIVWVVEAY